MLRNDGTHLSIVQERNNLMTQRTISDDKVSTTEAVEKKVYESPVLNVLGSEETANQPVAGTDGVTSAS